MKDETDFQHLTDYLRRWNGRRLLRDGLIWLPRAVLAGLMAAVVVAIVAWQRPLLDAQQLTYVAIGLGLAGLLVGLVGLLGRRHSLVEQASFADRQFGLRERAVTAVELQTHALPAPPDIAAAQLSDTLAAASLVDPARQLPFQLIRRDWLFLLASILLLILAVRLPNPQAAVLQQARAVQETIEQQIEALTALQEEIRQNEALTAEQQEELLEPIQDALQALQSGGLSQEGAVATLSEAEADLRQLAANTSADDLRRRLQEAGQPLADSSAASSLGQSLQNGDLFAAASAAAQLADDLPSLSQSEQEALAAALAETAESLRDVDSQLADQLAAAAEALQNGDIAAAQEALRQASGTLQQRAQEAAASQQAQAAAGQLAESRQEVAQAGQPGQSGQSGQTAQQGGQPGQGQGEGQGQGQGQGDGPQSLGQSEGGQPGGFGGTSAGGGSAESVFVPPFRDLSGEAGIDIELPAECRANPAACGALLSEMPTEFQPMGSTVPYAQVFGDYRNAASEALAGDYIPLGMKGFIRDYFSSLEP
jgi:ABC-type multidrug transport system fused ATPase/permease subunit